MSFSDAQFLSIEEMEQLINTTYKEQNQEVWRAFIFTLYTGIRFCDIKGLTFANVDYSNKLLKFEQNKTKGHSTRSGVIIPLNDGLLSLIGAASTDNADERIFKLPSQMTCLKALKCWTEKAGIIKHITWHAARHVNSSYSLKIKDLQSLSAWQVTTWKPASFCILQCSALI